MSSMRRVFDADDLEFIRLLIATGTPKYIVADRMGVAVKTLNRVLKRRAGR